MILSYILLGFIRKIECEFKLCNSHIVFYCFIRPVLKYNSKIRNPYKVQTSITIYLCLVEVPEFYKLHLIKKTCFLLDYCLVFFIILLFFTIFSLVPMILPLSLTLLIHYYCIYTSYTLSYVTFNHTG